MRRPFLGETQAAAALLFLLPVITHLPALLGYVQADPGLIMSGLARPQPISMFGAQYIDGNTGNTVQALGSLAAHDWLHGILPWWNPYSGAGLPLAASMQPGAFFLPFVLLLNANDGVMYMKLVLQIIAGLCTFAALRTRGLSHFAACVGGVLFELNGTFSWFGDAPIMPIAFLPMLIWGIEKLRADPSGLSSGGLMLVALALAFSLVAGFPQTAFLDGLLAGLWALDAVCRISLQSGARAAAVFIGRLTAGAICGLLLAAPATVPFLSYLRVGALGLHALSILGSLSAAQMPTLALPYVFGPIYADLQIGDWKQAGGYIGSTAMLLGLAGLMLARSQLGFRAILAGWSLVALAIVSGQPQFDALRLMLPILKDTTFCRYALPSISFASIVLAAMAVDDWTKGAWQTSFARRRLAIAAAVWLIGLCVCLARAWPRVGLVWPAKPFWMAGSIGLAMLSAGLCMLLLTRKPSRGQCMAFLGVVSLEAVLLFMPPVLAAPRSVEVDMAPLEYLRLHLGLGRVFAFDGQLVENYSARYDIASIDYLSMPAPTAWVDYVRKHLDPGSSAEFFGEGFGNGDALLNDVLDRHLELEQVGVSHVLVSAEPDPLQGADARAFRRVFTDGKASIYVLPNAKPYWDVQGGPCRILNEARDSLDAICDRRAVLLRRELQFDVWQARVNGHRARIAPYDDVFQSIDLPAGQSTVRFRYVPPDANLIAAAFCLGVLGLASMPLWTFRRRRSVHGAARLA